MNVLLLFYSSQYLFTYALFLFTKELLVSLPLVGFAENKGKKQQKNEIVKLGFLVVLNGFRISSLFDFRENARKKKKKA